MNHRMTTCIVLAIVCLFVAGIATVSASPESKTDTRKNLDILKPNITEINPTSGKVGEEVELTITGEGFMDDAEVYLENEEDKDAKIITASDVNQTSQSTLIATLDIPESAETGPWNVYVKENGKTSSSKIGFDIKK